MDQVKEIAVSEEEPETAENQRDIQYIALQYYGQYLALSDQIRLTILGYAFLMASKVKALLVINAAVYTLLILYVTLSEHPELSPIIWLGVGFLSGATFLIWVVQDILKRK